MNVRFLETLVWLARLRNFRLTAEKLHTTQASVSHRIATLEQDFGVVLFKRSPMGVQLTAEGEKAVVYAERIIKLTQQMERDLSDSREVAGTVRIGVIDTIVHSWLAQFLARVHELYPRILIELTSDTTHNLSEQLQKGALDLSFQARASGHEDMLESELCAFPMRWVASPLLVPDTGPMELADLARFPVISFPRHSAPHRHLQQLFGAPAYEGVQIHAFASVAAMIRLAADGFGVAVLPPAVISHELASQRLHLLDVPHPFPTLPVHACHRASLSHLVIPALVNVARQVLDGSDLNPATVASEGLALRT